MFTVSLYAFCWQGLELHHVILDLDDCVLRERNRRDDWAVVVITLAGEGHRD